MQNRRITFRYGYSFCAYGSLEIRISASVTENELGCINEFAFLSKRLSLPEADDVV